jgi:hypothetical protein
LDVEVEEYEVCEEWSKGVKGERSGWFVVKKKKRRRRRVMVMRMVFKVKVGRGITQISPILTTRDLSELQPLHLVMMMVKFEASTIAWATSGGLSGFMIYTISHQTPVIVSEVAGEAH